MDPEESLQLRAEHGLLVGLSPQNQNMLSGHRAERSCRLKFTNSNVSSRNDGECNRRHRIVLYIYILFNDFSEVTCARSASRRYRLHGKQGMLLECLRVIGHFSS